MYCIITKCLPSKLSTGIGLDGRVNIPQLPDLETTGLSIGRDEVLDIPQLPDAVPRGEFKLIKLSDGSPTVIAVDLETTGLSIGLDEEVDIPQLPDAVPRGEFKPIKLSDGSPTVIAVDVETTGLIQRGLLTHIIQLAAVDIGSGNKFNIYVSPKVPMTYKAEQITGISYNRNVMTVNGRPVKSFDISTACNKFCIWLEKFTNVVLMAHNGRRFDFPLLISAFSNTNKFQRFETCVAGCLDSLALFKKVYPGRSSYKQEGLVLDILKSGYNAHDALGDVLSLSSLFQKSSVPQADYMKLTFTPKAVHLNQMFLREKAKNMPSITKLVTRGICKSTTAENIAGSGLNLNNLRTIFDPQGEDGLHRVFTSKNSEGQPRVTGDKRTLESVIPKLAKYLKK